MLRSTPSSHWPGPARRPARRLLAVASLAAVASCSPQVAPGDEVAIGVGALPGRPGYENVVRGVTLAVDRLNEAGGPRFRVALPADSASSAVAVAAAHRADPSVIAVVGHPESGATQATIPVYAGVGENDHEAVALVSPTASSPALSGISPWFFRVAPSDAAGAQDVARYAWDSLRVGIAAVIYRNDAYGRDWAEAFATAWKDRGGTVPIRDPYRTGQTDWSIQAAHIARVDPDVVLFPGDTDDAAALLRALRDVGARAAFIGGDGAEGIARLPEFAGARYVSFYREDSAAGAAATRFANAWRAAYRDAPDMFGALSYDAALAIGTAWRAASVKSRAGLREALAAVTLDGAGGRIAFDAATHDVVGRSIVVVTVRAAR